MNKTKTGILAITVLGLAGSGSALGQPAASRYPITPQQQSTAEQVAQAGVRRCSPRASVTAQL